MPASSPPRAIALYLAVVQFLFALGWTVYATYLPELLQRAGVERAWTPWILALDQAVFALADLAMGVAMDRARASLRRVGPWLIGLVVLSSLAMIAMPGASALGGGPFLALTVVWVASSAALRVPPFALMGRYAAQSSVPWLAGLMLLGMALAAALAPFLGLLLKQVDPALPFALASVAIVASSLGLVSAERSLAANATGSTETGTPLPLASRGALLLIGALLLALLGYQVQVGLNAGEQIRRVADPALLPWLLPVFWAGFAFGLIPADHLGKRLGSARAFAAGCVGGALALGFASSAGSVALLAPLHGLAGAAWAVALANAFGLATRSGRAGAEGRYTGILFALFALGSLVRIALSLAGVPQALQGGTDWLAVAAWAGAALLLLQMERGRRTA